MWAKESTEAIFCCSSCIPCKSPDLFLYNAGSIVLHVTYQTQRCHMPLTALWLILYSVCKSFHFLIMLLPSFSMVLKRLRSWRPWSDLASNKAEILVWPEFNEPLRDTSTQTPRFKSFKSVFQPRTDTRKTVRWVKKEQFQIFFS